LHNQLKISQLRRKRIATILLINFLFSTILFAFPQSKCDGMCSIEVESHQCADMKEMTCCEMMDMNNTNSTPCGMEITDNSCDYMIDAIDDITFLVPKTIDTSIELLEIAHIILNEIEKTPDFFIKSQNTLLNSSPPIYITISSFLI
jgi:hypothetical protein